MRYRFVRMLAAIVAVVVAATACGLTLDDSPREISTSRIPQELRPGQPTPTPVPASASGPGRNQIHMIKDNTRLVTVERQIVDTPEDLMRILLLGTFPEEKADDIETAIYRGTEVQSIEVNELFDLAIVDLAPGSLASSSNSEQRLAFAQIVYTLTSLPEIESVQFVQTDPANPDAGTVDIAVQTDAGTVPPGTRVTRQDFARLAPGSETALPSFDIPLATPTPNVDPEAPPRFELAVWMIDDTGALTKVPRTIEVTPDAHLVALLEGPRSDERNNGIRSALPPDALANPIEIGRYDVLRTDEFGFETLENLRIATIDFETGSLPALADDEEQFLALAQIVLTLTQLEPVDQVAISLDGQFILMPIDYGELTLPFEPNITRGVDATDYQTALLSAEERAVQTAPPAPTPLPSVAPSATPDPAATAESATPTPTPTTTPGG